METNNPYTSPQSNLFGGSAETTTDGVTQGVLLQLQKTKPWVRLMSVVMFLGAGLMLLGGLAMGLMGAAGTLNQTASPFGGQMGAVFGVGMAAMYGILAVLYVFPALKLWKYADRIRDLLASRQLVDLERALNEQRAFWKFVGVMIVVVLIIYAVAIIVGGVIAVSAMMKASGKM